MKVVFRVPLLSRTVGRSKNLEGVGGNPRSFEGEGFVPILAKIVRVLVPKKLTEPIQFFSENQAGDIYVDKAFFLVQIPFCSTFY